MLSSFATFIFGTYKSDDKNPETETFNDGILHETDVKSSVGEDWILIDINKKNTDENENSSKLDNNYNDTFKPLDSNDLNDSNIANDQMLALNSIGLCKKIQSNINLEESWFVTPPPCFTNPNTFEVTSSPMENILIEHPSISVFHHRSTCANVMTKSNLPGKLSSMKPFESKPISRSKNAEKENKVSQTKDLNVRNQQRNHRGKFRKNKNGFKNSGHSGVTKNNSQSLKTKENENDIHRISDKKGFHSVQNQIQEHSYSFSKSPPTHHYHQRQGSIIEITNIMASMQKQKEKRSHKYLKKSFMDRQNLVIYQRNFRPSRRNKITLKQNGYSNNRKSY